MKCTSLQRCKLFISNCTFDNNSATIQGGAIYYDYAHPTINQTLFISNYALYGPNFASYPVRIGLINSSKDDEIVVSGVGSGIILQKNLKIALIDYDEQVMVLDNSSQVIILSKNLTEAKISGVNTVKIKNGVGIFTRFAAISKPGSTGITFKISSKSINQQEISTIFENEITQKDLTMNFRFWKPGERILGESWTEWGAGTFSFEWNSTEWHKCLDNAVWFGQEVALNPGYWRKDTNSTFITEWINTEAWEGGYYPSNNYPIKCTEGYKGILCSKCQVTPESKYEKVNSIQCNKCPKPILNAIRVIGLILLIFSFFMVLIVINVKKTKESTLSVLLRILTNYFQLMTTSMSMSASYPDSLTNILVPVNRLGGSSETFLSFDWFIVDYEIKGPFPSNSIFKLFLLGLLPLIIFTIVTLIWVVVYVINRKYVKDLKRWLVISFISILFLLHPKVTEESISTFRWIKIDVNTYVARIDTDISWYSEEHIKWLFLIAIPMIIVWVITLPIVSLILLYNSFKDENSKIKHYLMILYQGLKPSIFYWEFVNSVRKVFILSVLVISNNSLKVVLSSIMLIVTGRLQTYLRPYRNEEHNKVELYAIIAGVVTILSGLVFIQKDEVVLLNICILIVILVLNVLFIFNWTLLLLKHYEDKSKYIYYVSLWYILI